MNLSVKSFSILSSTLLLTWNNNSNGRIKLSSLRKACPCAGCSGENDALGNVYMNQPSVLSKNAFVLLRYEKIGLYGVRFFWKDGHHDGIYTFDLLKSLQDE